MVCQKHTSANQKANACQLNISGQIVQDSNVCVHAFVWVSNIPQGSVVLYCSSVVVCKVLYCPVSMASRLVDERKSNRVLRLVPLRCNLGFDQPRMGHLTCVWGGVWCWKTWNTRWPQEQFMAFKYLRLQGLDATGDLKAPMTSGMSLMMRPSTAISI